MKTEKKIFLNRNDDLEVAVDRLIKTGAHIVILNIPRDSVLGASINNFHVLRRESQTAGKELLIESVDERILELAALARLSAFNPVFREKERVISDILPQPKFKEEKKIIPPAPEQQVFKKPKKQKILHKVVFLMLLVILAALGFFLANVVLPKAKVEMVLKKIPVSFAHQVEVSSTMPQVRREEEKILVPGELLEARRNLSMSFSASGREQVQRKASGILTVYNAFSSLPQTLVATTRFLSPQGKLFRLEERVVIPGAKVEDGKIIPSQIEVSVTADEPGEESNIGPTKNWRIPGFKGSPRYEGFYADSAEAMTHGFIGTLAVPTKEDIEKGKKELLANLEDALHSQTLVLLSDRFKVFPSSRRFKVLKEEVLAAEADGSFKIFAEAELKVLIFEEAMLKEAVVAEALGTREPDLRVREFSLNYSEPQVILETGRMTFQVEGSIVFEPDLDVFELKQEFVGRGEEELRKTVSYLPGLERANISLWPFWVNRVPKQPDKIEIILK